MKQIKIKPKAGVKVVKPDTKLALAEQGEIVIQDSYWLRRLADGDVLLCEEPTQQTQAPAKAAKGSNEGGPK